MDKSLQNIPYSFKRFWISIFLISGLTLYVQGSATSDQIPAYACTGDTVVIKYELALDEPDQYEFDFPRRGTFCIEFTEIEESQFGTNYLVNGINLLRVTASFDPANNGEIVRANLTIVNFTTSDGLLDFGFSHSYNDRGVSSETYYEAIGYIIFETVAPSAVTILETSANFFNSTTCESAISLFWTDSQQSDATASSYLVYLNGAEVGRTSAPVIFFLDVRTLQLEFQYIYSVSAANCNGISPQLSTILNIETPPSLTPVSSTTYISTIDPSSCAVSIGVNWSTSLQNHKQILYENGIEIASIDYPLTSYSQNTTIQLNRGYNYSVATSNCYEVSSQFESAIISPIKSYNITSNNVSILYNESSNTLHLHWDLTQDSDQILLIEYFLQVNYTYTQDCVTEYFNTQITLSLFSSITEHSMQLVHHSFYTVNGLSTEIPVSLQLVRQCGQAFPQKILGSISTFLSYVSPSTSTYISTIDPSSCVASINVSFPAQNYSQILYENGIEIESLDYLLTSYSHNTTLLLNSEYSYSITSSDCNGISPQSEIATISPITSYNFTKDDVSILYNESSDSIDLHWNLTQNSFQILLIEYFLQINYTYTQDGVAEYYLNQTTFSLFSNITTSSLQLIDHTFSTNNGLSTNISVSLKLMEQCGQALPQRILLGSFSTTTPSVENAAFNSVIPGSILGLIGFLILAACIFLIIVVSVGMYIYWKHSKEEDTNQTNEGKDKDLELNQKETDQAKSPNDSAPNNIYANPENCD